MWNLNQRGVWVAYYSYLCFSRLVKGFGALGLCPVCLWGLYWTCHKEMIIYGFWSTHLLISPKTSKHSVKWGQWCDNWACQSCDCVQGTGHALPGNRRDRILPLSRESLGKSLGNLRVQGKPIMEPNKAAFWMSNGKAYGWISWIFCPAEIIKVPHLLLILDWGSVIWLRILDPVLVIFIPLKMIKPMFYEKPHIYKYAMKKV